MIKFNDDDIALLSKIDDRVDLDRLNFKLSLHSVKSVKEDTNADSEMVTDKNTE